MLRVEKFKADDLRRIEKTRISRYLDRTITDEMVAKIEAGPYARSIFDEEGNLLFCGGVIPIYRGRGEAWAVFANGSFGRVRDIIPLIENLLAEVPLSRIEAAAIVGFAAAHRLLVRLGFELEAPRLRAFHPEGHDCAMYAIVRGGSSDG